MACCSLVRHSILCFFVFFTSDFFVQLDTLISNMMSAARDLLEVDIATLFLVDRYSRTLWKLNTGAGQEIIRMPMTAGLAGFVATTGQTVNIPDVYQDERFNQKFDKQTGYRTRSMLCMPVFDRNNQVLTHSCFCQAIFFVGCFFVQFK